MRNSYLAIGLSGERELLVKKVTQGSKMEFSLENTEKKKTLILLGGRLDPEV